MRRTGVYIPGTSLSKGICRCTESSSSINHVIQNDKVCLFDQILPNDIHEDRFVYLRPALVNNGHICLQ